MMRSSNQVPYKSIVLYYQWLSRPDRVTTSRWTRWCSDLLSASGGTFGAPQTNFYQIERDQLKSRRERGPDLHGDADPVRSVSQPSVRPLDTGRLLQLRGVLRTDRPQELGGLSRTDHLQPRWRRSEASGHRPECHSRVPRWWTCRDVGPGPPGRPREVAGVARESILRPQLCQPHLAALLRHRHHRSGRRCPREQSPVQPRTARCPGGPLHGEWLRLQTTGAGDLPFEDLSAVDVAERQQPDR